MRNNEKKIIKVLAPACFLAYDECEFCYYAGECGGIHNPAYTEIKITDEVLEDIASGSDEYIVITE